MDLLNFDGVSFRARDAADLGLVGMTIGDCSLHFDNAVVAGVVKRLEGTNCMFATKNKSSNCTYQYVSADPFCRALPKLNTSRCLPLQSIWINFVELQRMLSTFAKVLSMMTILNY